MNTRCTVCHHPQRAEIEQALVAGVTLREIGKRFDRSKTTIAKHAKKHVPAAAQKALEAANDREVEAGDAILAEVEKLKSEARRLQAHAEREKDYRAALTAVRELTRLVELSARLLGELRDHQINLTNVQVDPQTLDRMVDMYVMRRAAKGAKPDTAGPVAAIAAPSTLTVDVSSGLQPPAAVTEAVSNGGSI